MSDQTQPIRWPLLCVAFASVACGLLHALYPDRFDDKTAMFLAVAVVALVIDQVTKFKGLGIEFEKRVENAEKAISGLEKDLGPGSKTALTTAPVVAPAMIAPDAAHLPPINPQDPNKGQFGGQKETGGRRLSAVIKPDAGPSSSRCRVHIRIESTDDARPLAGKVKLHLHPTFDQWASYEIDVKGGVAEDEIVSYGAFTIGAEADNGATKLELDLMDVRGGTKRFYEE